MIKPDDNELRPQFLLDFAPQDLMAWLTRNLTEGPETTADADAINWWLGLIASTSAGADQPLERGAIAIHVYEHLALATGNPTFRRDAMMRRVKLIRNFGPASGDPNRDPNVVLQWYRDQQFPPLPEIASQVANWTTLPIDAIRDLRKMKACLSVLQLLVDDRIIAPDSELQAWLELRPRLL